MKKDRKKSSKTIVNFPFFFSIGLDDKVNGPIRLLGIPKSENFNIMITGTIISNTWNPID